MTWNVDLGLQKISLDNGLAAGVSQKKLWLPILLFQYGEILRSRIIEGINFNLYQRNNF